MQGLWLRLVIPLTVVAVVSVAIHAGGWDADGFFLNIATEFIGIIVTVAYVDWVLRNHHLERWRGTDERIQKLLTGLVRDLTVKLTSTFGYDRDILNQDAMRKDQRTELARVLMHVLRPTLRSSVEKLTDSRWGLLQSGLKETATRARDILEPHTWRLAPKQVEALMDIQSSAETATFMWEMFPQLFGEADHSIEKESARILREGGFSGAEKDLGVIIDAACKLIDVSS